MNLTITIVGHTIRRAIKVGILLWLACNLAMLAIGAGVIWRLL
jgi:hypothetical protein